jgi:hypothetical protein
LPDVEELGDDLATRRLDELAGACDLPLPGRFRILLIFGADPPVEREVHDAMSIPPDVGWLGLLSTGCGGGPWLPLG